jgi:hypothetical protein
MSDKPRRDPIDAAVIRRAAGTSRRGKLPEARMM